MSIPAQRKKPRQCQRCLLEFEQLADDKNRICQDCHNYIPDLHSDPNRVRAYNMGAELTHLRIAFAQIEYVLRGTTDMKARIALAILERVAAPMRTR